MKLFPSKQTLSIATKYLAVGAAVFAVGLVWNFPYERFKETLTGILSKRTGYKVDVETLSPALPIGFLAKAARINYSPVGGRNLNLEADSLRVTVSPFSLLLYPIRKTLWFSYSVKIHQSKWTGDIEWGKDKMSFAWQTKDFKLNTSIPLGGMNPLFTGSDLKLNANISFSADLSSDTQLLNRGDLSASDGHLSLTAMNATVEAPIVKMLPFDKIKIDAVLEKGTIEVKSINLSGGTISGNAKGTIKMDPYYLRSQLNLDAKLSISDKAESLRSLAQTYMSSLGIRMDETGTMAIRITGPLDRPAIRGF